MEEWYKNWFDADYSALYTHRDEAEAEAAVRTALATAPALGEGPVLDLACGSGRHLAELRQSNPQAFGLDLSAHLLGEALPELRPWLLRADMRRLPIRPGTLSGITLWFTPFGYFSEADNRALLGRLRDSLKPGGILLLDFLNSAHLQRTLVEEDLLERNGLRACSRRSIEQGRIVKRMTLTRLDSGAQREVVESVRLYSPEELRRMTASFGFVLKTELGDYEGIPFLSETSPRWIGVLEFKP